MSTWKIPEKRSLFFVEMREIATLLLGSVSDKGRVQDDVRNRNRRSMEYKRVKAS